MLFFILPALALNCDSADEPCVLTNLQADVVEAHTGVRHIDDNASKARFRSDSVLAKNIVLTEALTNNGCTAPVWVDAGIYGQVTFSGLYQASPFGVGTGGGTTEGEVHRASQSFVGTYDQGLGDYGNLFASYNAMGRILTQYDDQASFVAGHWIRIKGRRGVFVNFEGGTCPDTLAALTPWFDGIVVQN